MYGSVLCRLPTNQSLDAVLEERICGPLKMRDTGFKVPKDGQHSEFRQMGVCRH